MGLFRHPHLIRGIVHTSEGAFQIERGLAQVSDEIGTILGWVRVDEQTGTGVAAPRPAAARGASEDHAGAM
jgi:hypothetical protein